MRLVVDTNVIFSAMIADGATRDVLLTGDHAFEVPEYFHSELLNNLDTVQEKTGLDRGELELLLDLLFDDIAVVPSDEFAYALDEAEELIADTDPDDVPFVALALHRDAAIWSDDEDLQEQTAVRVYRTHELIDDVA
jgi:predicted nucleic acid-binding protein